MVDVFELAALVRQLGLSSYRWLPKQLLIQFCRESGVPADVTLPTDLPWGQAGRPPKHGESHHEDLDRYLTWFYRRTVKGDPWKAIERDYLRTKRAEGLNIAKGRSTVKNGVARAAQFLAASTDEHRAVFSPPCPAI
jgi:hypothetical protein